jgi:hypothetical protein
VTEKLIIQQFRDAVYQNLHKRQDAILDLIEALTVASHGESPVALSEEAPFRLLKFRFFVSAFYALNLLL